jgi:hypothetical protein
MTVSTTSTEAAPTRMALKELVLQSQNVLFSFSSFFPFDLFPDTITIDENKVNIIRRNFIGMTTVHSVMVSDITDVVVDTFLVWATMRIVVSSNYLFPITETTKTLRISDALKARDIIQGLIASKKKEIDFKDLPSQEVKAKVEQAGKIFEE